MAEEGSEEESKGGSEDIEISVTDLREDFSMTEYIVRTHSSLLQRQVEIDSGTFAHRKPGRRRTKPYRTTDELEELISTHLKTKIDYICSIPCRPDSVSTKLYRLLRGLPKFLLDNCSSKSIYKKSEIDSYLFSFLESYISFFPMAHHNEPDLVKSFVEYSII